MARANNYGKSRKFEVVISPALDEALQEYMTQHKIPTAAQEIVTAMITIICMKSDAITAQAPPVTDITITTRPVAMMVVSILKSNRDEVTIARPFNPIPAEIDVVNMLTQAKTCSFLLPNLRRNAWMTVTTRIWRNRGAK